MLKTHLFLTSELKHEKQERLQTVSALHTKSIICIIRFRQNQYVINFFHIVLSET